MTPSTLLGRQSEIAAFDAVATSVTAGSAALFGVRGEAGMGKSTLVNAAVARAGELGFTVMRAGLSEVESHLGWAGLRLLCRDVTDAELATLDPGVRHAIPAATGRGTAASVDPTTVAFAFADLVGRRLAEGPTAIVIDDLHWMDTPTASAVAYATRSNAGRPLLVVVAHRPVDIPMEPARLLDTDRVTQLDIGGLSDAGVNRLLRTRLDVRLDRTDVQRVRAATGGSPLHVIEIGRLIQRGVGLDDALVHPSAYDMILARVEALPLGTRAVLLAAALVGGPTVRRLSAALPDSDVEAELEPAVKQQLIDIRSDVIAFTHPLARAATVAEAGGAARRAMQLRLAAATDDEDERVELLVAASDQPDDELAAEVDAAAERAADRGDLAVALRLARRAVELTPADRTRARAERLLTAAELAAAGGDSVAPVELASAAGALDDDLEVVFRAAVIAGLTLANRGDLAASHAVLDAAVERFADHPAKLARIHDIRAQVLFNTNVERALEAASAAVTAATAGGDPEQIERQRALLAVASVHAGEPVDLDAIEAIAADLPDTSITKDWYADALSFSERASSSLRISEPQIAEYRRLGLVHYETVVIARVAADLVTLGRFRDAERYMNEWLDLQSLCGGVPSYNIRADIAFIQVVLGEVERGCAEFEAAVQGAATGSEPAALFTLWSRGCQLATALGDWTSAAERALAAADAARAAEHRNVAFVPYRVEGVEALLHLGRVTEAEELAAEHVRLARRGRAPRWQADIARVEAALAASRGDVPAAAAAWQTALDEYDRVELPLDRAISLLGLGALLRRAGKRSEARRRLEEADAAFAAMEAVTYRSRVASELERLGSRRTAPDKLTPTERRIAELVEAGLSNAEIASTLSLSVRTVESNLTRAYRKLGIRRRTELAAALRTTA